MRRALVIIATVVATLVSPVGPAAAAAPPLSETEQAMVTEINQTRAAAGSGPLVVHLELSALSRGWAQTMADNNNLVHASPITEGFNDPWLKMGENIGYAWSVESMMDAFRNSPGHYANLIDPDYTHVGVGVVWKGSQLWTTHRFFESPTPPPPPVVHLCEGEPATIVGTAGNDMLLGTAGPDVIVGLGGNDLINGRGGHDLICAGGGDDYITGGRGSDEVYGQGGDDTVVSSGGKDFVNGGMGNDVLNGNLGKDQVWGSGGTDVCWGERMRCETKFRTLHNGTKLY
ncbi:MAG: CAP domain-containing protein [Acidimicrobiia bacterium]|nr:CAP domain-containing protein [Acidimicrobiia bacterium]